MTAATTCQPADLVETVRQMFAETDDPAIKAGDVADRLADEYDIEIDIGEPERNCFRQHITGPLLSRILYHAGLFPHPQFGDVEWVTEDRHDWIIEQDSKRHDQDLRQRAKALSSRTGDAIPHVKPALIMRYSPTNAKKRAERERNAPIEPLLPDGDE